jgi:hypothetical protein
MQEELDLVRECPLRMQMRKKLPRTVERRDMGANHALQASIQRSHVVAAGLIEIVECLVKMWMSQTVLSDMERRDVSANHPHQSSVGRSVVTEVDRRRGVRRVNAARAGHRLGVELAWPSRELQGEVRIGRHRKLQEEVRIGRQMAQTEIVVKDQLRKT